jgi:curved DNA-binding protein CbpA
MIKKNYYELFGISPNTPKEQIWQKVIDLQRKFFDDNPTNDHKEWWERYKKFNNILGVLTNDKERERYNKHLAEFGSDENFQLRFDIRKSEREENAKYFASIRNKVSKKNEEDKKKLKWEWWKTHYDMQKALEKIAEMNKEWNCWYCQRPYEKLIIPSKQKLEPKLCLVCFAFLQGHTLGKGGKISKEHLNNAVEMIKKVERNWALATEFEIISVE